MIDEEPKIGSEDPTVRVARAGRPEAEATLLGPELPDLDDDLEPPPGLRLPPPSPPAVPRVARRAWITAAAWGLIPALMVLALAFGGFWYWLHAEFRTQYGALGDRVDALDVEVQKTWSQTRSLESGVEGLRMDLKAVSDAQTALSVLFKTLSDATLHASISSDDWALAEAEYLLVVAGQRLQLERDIKTARLALAAADDRLRSLDAPHLIPVREALASEMNELDSVQLPDISGLAVEIADLADHSADLPLKGGVQPAAEAADVAVSDTAPRNRWRAALDSVWSELKSLVVIRRQSAVDPAVLEPDLRFMLEQELRLQLMSVRLAVLRRDDANASASVAAARELVNRYFDTSEGRVSSLLSSLDVLEKVDLDPPLPDLSHSLALLRGLERAPVPSTLPDPEAKSR